MTTRQPNYMKAFAPCRRGTVLIATIWVSLVLAGLVLTLAQSMRVEVARSANGEAAIRASAAEQGAIQYLLAHLDGLSGQVPADTDIPCEAVQVGNEQFWVLRPNPDDDQNYYFGVVDEASKLNLNTASADALSRLPNMTSDLAACIVDWRDSDSNVTTGGAESQYYLMLPDPYNAKNGPLETVEELLRIKDFTRPIVYGEDSNLNGVLDPNENDGDDSDPPDNRDGRLNRGLWEYVTVYSREPNVSANGSTRVNVNQTSPSALFNLLRSAVSGDRLPSILAQVPRNRPFRNAFDFYYKVGLEQAEFEKIADRITTSGSRTLTGMVNVNTAPKAVLACLPGLTDSDVSALLAERTQSAQTQDSIAWVASALSREKAVAIGGLITARSYQFSADIVSVSGNGRAFKRARVVVDTQTSPPRVIFYKDLTGLGWPLAPEVQSQLRAGAGPIVPVQSVIQRSQ